MALHPRARQAAEESAAETPYSTPGYDIAAARAANRAEAVASEREEVATVEDVDANGVPARLYTPAGALPGLVVHLHGGGFVFHDVEVHDPLCRRLANRSGLRVLSVDYRLRARAPVPGGARRRRHRPRLGGDPTRAGRPAAPRTATRPAATWRWWRRCGGPSASTALALLYPFLDPTAGFGSYLTHADGFSPEEAAWYWDQYAATPADRDDPDLAPLLSGRLGDLPPTLVVTAEHDPLRDEGEELALRLAEAGVRVAGFRCLGQIHGYCRHLDFDAAEPTMLAVATYLRAAALA